MIVLNKNIVLPTLFLGLLTFSTLHADLLTQYRLQGIENIEQQMDTDLAQEKYWDKYLKNKDTRFGYLESYKNILFCDKSKATLSLYIKDKDNVYNPIKKYSAFTGKFKGDKAKEGDLRTPDGVYTITKKLDKVDPFYGPMAFVTSYPNSYDTYQGKGGHGIWIHGLPTSQERDSFTKGCIAINNKSIECLNKHINIDQTLLIINEKADNTKVSKKNLANVLSQLYAWRYAWIYNDLESYLHFYSPKFKRFDGVNIQNFRHYKKRVFAKNEKKTILFTKLNVIPYPGSDNTYKITFFETYKANSFSFLGNKVLIVKLENSQMKIITEK